MAFLTDIKNEICASPPRTPCCKRMLLLGMLSARGFVVDKNTVVLRVSDAATSELAVRLIAEQYGRQAEHIPQKHGGRVHEVRFESHSASKFLVDLEDRFLKAPLAKQCVQCSFSFLKGLFLASGHITDPSKAYHLELSLGERAEAFTDFFKRVYQLVPKIARRRNETLLYWKDSATLEEIMTMLGINDAAFAFMNSKIEKQFRNEANRRTNCEASNINRSVLAASRIVSVIGKLKDEKLLSSLPDELEEAAKLRFENPEASLLQLAAMMTPPLTKSGLNHRLQKILDYAKRMGIEAEED